MYIKNNNNQSLIILKSIIISKFEFDKLSKQIKTT